MIDFGAGSGTFAIPCAAAGFDVTAVEPDDRLRAMVIARPGSRAVRDAAALPDETFEYAYTLNVLEHIDADVEALRTLRAKLVPGGRLFVYVPAFPVLFTSMDAKVRHVRRYTRATLRASLRRSGLRDSRRSATPTRWALPRRLVFKAFDNGRGDVNRRMLRLYDRVAFPVSRALDALTHRWFGKNLLALAVKPGV